MNIRKIKAGNFTYLLSEAWVNRRILYLYFTLNIACSLIIAATGILTPRFMIAELSGQGQIKRLLVIAGVYLFVMAVAGYLSEYIKSNYELNISRFRYSFIQRMKEKVMGVRYESLENPQYLNEFWRVESATSDVEFGIQGIITRMFVLSGNAVSSLLYFSILGRLNFLIVILLIGNIYLVYLFRSKTSRYEVETSKKASIFGRRQRYLTNVMGDMAYGKDIRIYGLSNFLLGKLMDNQKSRRKIDIDIQKKHYGADFVESILSCARDLLIYFYLVYCVLRGIISIADFTMCFMAVAILTITLEQVFEDVAFIRNDLFRIDEMRKFLAIPDEGEEISNRIPIPAAEKYELTFQHVSFRYPGADRNVYTDFNFTIKGGEKLAIVGINGAGKTTIVKLVARLYDPSEGCILLNGIDIRKFDLQEYRNLLTTVFQDINLFAMTLKENITCTAGEYDEKKLLSAIENAGLTAFFEQHGRNLDLPLTRYLSDDGVDVSGGEKQKIGIARSLYKDGRIMIFDEPTSALDAHAEYTLYHRLAELTAGKTLLFISHRLASTRFCDRIALIDGGQVAELGSHKQLLEKQGLYYQMFHAQKKYYEEGNGHDK